ncbi:MAG: hypothetical protein INR71_01185 [Terriglobus roseus]|nr:hypothetical protein [Terriglobus roseus]
MYLAAVPWAMARTPTTRLPVTRHPSAVTRHPPPARPGDATASCSGDGRRPWAATTATGRLPGAICTSLRQ